MDVPNPGIELRSALQADSLTSEPPGKLGNAGLNDSEVEIKNAGRNINNLRYADDATLMVECEEELKRLMMRVKVEGEKTGLKLNIQKTKIMASGPITLWQIEGEKWKQ